MMCDSETQLSIILTNQHLGMILVRSEKTLSSWKSLKRSKIMSECIIIIFGGLQVNKRLILSLNDDERFTPMNANDHPKS